VILSSDAANQHLKTGERESHTQFAMGSDSLLPHKREIQPIAAHA
jgi:hypothetical protein